MQQYLNRFQYGNRDISGEHSPFWIDGSLEISAAEQADFLSRFVAKKLGLSDRTYQAASAVFKRDQIKDAVLYAKTGTSGRIGWFVGFVENKENKFIFAFNMLGSAEEIARRRVVVPLQVLHALGVWPGSSIAK